MADEERYCLGVEIVKRCISAWPFLEWTGLNDTAGFKVIHQAGI